MEWSDKVIAALGVAIVALLGGIGALYAKLRQVTTSDWIKGQKARAKFDEDQRQAALSEWRELHAKSLAERNEIRQEMDIQTEHRIRCETEVAVLRTQVHELLEWKSSVIGGPSPSI